MQIDLNADLGEGYGPWSMGDDDAMLSIVTSANIACGGHAGDPETMYRTLATAAANKVTVGAHPGYLDRTGFGRRIIPMAPGEIARMIGAQIGALRALAAMAGTNVRYVKPHGALGNLAARDGEVARAVVDAVGGVDADLAVLAISGTQLEHVAKDVGLRSFSEIFADRAYTPEGQLVPRSEPDAMIHDANEATDRLLAFLESGTMPTVGGDAIPLAAESICVHGDSPGAVDMAHQIRKGLLHAGVEVRAFVGPDD